MAKEYKGVKGFDVIKTEHFGIQRKIVANMTAESWDDIPHSALQYEPDATEFLAEIKKLNASGNHKRKITVNMVMLKAIAEGLKAAPEMNGYLKFSRRFVKGKHEMFEDVNVSVPWMLPDGKMMTINIHNVNEMSLDELADYMADVSRRIEKTNMTEAMFEVSMDNTITALKHGKIATVLCRLIGAKLGKYRVKTLSGKAKKEYKAIPKTDRITKADIEQGTITVSNIGSIYRGNNVGVTLLEVIPPQLVAICLAAITEKPAVFVDENGEKQIGIRSMFPICIAFDHRALDFGEVKPFLERLDDIFANPSQIQGW